jgi:hypothetical protein
MRMDAMDLNREPKYPSRHANVLKVERDAKSDALAGRLANLITGRHCAFAYRGVRGRARGGAAGCPPRRHRCPGVLGPRSRCDEGMNP